MDVFSGDAGVRLFDNCCSFAKRYLVCHVTEQRDCMLNYQMRLAKLNHTVDKILHHLRNPKKTTVCRYLRWNQIMPGFRRCDMDFVTIDSMQAKAHWPMGVEFLGTKLHRRILWKPRNRHKDRSALSIHGSFLLIDWPHFRAHGLYELLGKAILVVKRRFAYWPQEVSPAFHLEPA